MYKKGIFYFLLIFFAEWPLSWLNHFTLMRDSIAHHCMLADEFTLTTLATEEEHRRLVL